MYRVARLTKRRLAIDICLLAAILAAGYALYRYHFRIKAAIWHVLHGNSVILPGYRMSVPSHWFPEQDTTPDLYLWNARTGESIWLRSFPKPRNFTLALWSDLEQRRLNDPKNPIVERREIQVAGDPFVCFEKDFEVALPPTSSPKQTVHMPSVWCRSSGPLDITFFGGVRAAPRHDYGEFYSILSTIHKSSP